MKRFLNGTVVPFLAFWWILLVSLSLRVRLTGAETKAYADANPCILVLWHSRIFYFPFHLSRHRDLYALVSPSSDGDIINGTLRMFGMKTVRGSSFQRGAAALIALAKRLRKGGSAVMIADGSRGPALIAQPGSIYLAKLTGHKIIPVAWGAKRTSALNTWDKTIFPHPFSRLNLIYGAPIEVDRKIDDEGIEAKRKELEAELLRITALADDFSQ